MEPWPEVGHRRGALEDLARAGIDLGALRPMVLRRDSASWSSSSSIGMARVNRLPKVRSTSSGASPGAVDEPGGRLEEALAHRDEDERGHAGRPPWRARATSLSPVVFGACPRPSTTTR